MNFEEQLAACIHGVVAIMGIGNPLRGDDAAGSFVARSVRQTPNACVIDAQDVPEDYLSLVVDHHPDTVVLIDSVDLHSAPGSVALLNTDQMAGYWPSTHRVPLRVLMNYLEQETDARMFLVAIQPGHTAFLKPLSEEVSASVARIAAMLNQALERPRDITPGEFTGSRNREVPA